MGIQETYDPLGNFFFAFLHFRLRHGGGEEPTLGVSHALLINHCHGAYEGRRSCSCAPVRSLIRVQLALERSATPGPKFA